MNETAVVLLIIKLMLTGGIMFFLYQDARARDYAWFMWTFIPVIAVFAAGFAGSIITLALIFLLYLLTRPKGGLVKCPHCGKKIHNVLAFCPYCHQSVKRECLRCHDTVDWEAERCPHCGSANLTKF
ncbi:MAG: zinc ribbon domain-containing protein [Firmicutes bacterium]|nr:zinc ribbon domain-containing protein [Bacillota bacterium]